MATLKEIAQRTGYSPATISRILSGDPQLSVTPEARRKVLEEAGRLNYTQTKSRRGRTPKGVLRVGIAEMLSPVQQLDDPYYLYLSGFVRQRCLDKRYTAVALENRGSEFVVPTGGEKLDGIVATEKEQAAAKEFLNWIVFSEIGQQMLVKTCNIIPPFQNNPYEPSDPLSRDIYSRVHEGKAFNASAIVPNDHWSVLGAALQKYLADRSDRAELIDSIVAYWDEQQ